MELTKEKIYGITGSIIFYIVLLLFLFFTFVRTEIKAKEEGILLNFGSVDLAAGTFIPKGDTPEAAQQEAGPNPPAEEIPEIPKPKPQTQPVVQQKPQTKPQAKPQTKPQAKPTPPPITQNLEQTAAIEAAKQRQQEAAEAAKQRQREKEAAEQLARAEQAQREQAAKAEQARLAEEQRKRDAINQQVSGAFGSGTAGRGGQGTGQSGSGIQGSPNGTSSSHSGGGYGEFNLGGRSLGTGGLPRPSYSAQEEGKIVIDITVDPRGNVILAEIGKGTTINSDTMRKSALEAARKAKFSSITENNNQSGTITYRYSLK